MESLLLKYVNNFWTVWPKTLIVCLHLKQKVKQLWGKICVRTPSKHNTNNGIEKKLTENYRNCPPPSTIFLSICWLVQRTEIISFSFPFQPNNLYRVDPDSWGNFPMLNLQSSAKSPLSPGAMSVWISESHWDLRWAQVSWSINPIYWIVQRVRQQIPSAFWPYFMELQSLKSCVEGKKSYFTFSEILEWKNGVWASVWVWFGLVLI